jgi:alkaline phosphatase D
VATGGGRYRTDGWDGYPAARKRLLAPLAGGRVPGVVVLGGDVHANFVADLRADADDARSPLVASEFCGTSISSHGAPQAATDAALALNPHFHWGRSDQRGSVHFALDGQRLAADLRVVDEPRDAASAVRSAARFSVEQQRPGIERG